MNLKEIIGELLSKSIQTIIYESIRQFAIKENTDVGIGHVLNLSCQCQDCCKRTLTIAGSLHRRNKYRQININ